MCLQAWLGPSPPRSAAAFVLDFHRNIAQFGRMLPKSNYESLRTFIREEMRMSHIYQPVMLRILLERGGAASLEEIAKALLSYDSSQVEYYEIRTKSMVGKVLAQNGVAEPVIEGRRIKGYRLAATQLTDGERTSLLELCDARLRAYLDKRGSALWSHRANAEGHIPGSVRYDVLKRARHRCELCGAHEDQAALHIDHIVPRARGGSDDISNFQTLCITCNTNKRDRDDTDFRGGLAAYEHRVNNCLFCSITPDRVVAENTLCYAIRDGFPVTHLHTLIIPKRHVADYFDLFQPEINAIHALLSNQRATILAGDPTVSAFNVGINAGRDAGQTIFHVHAHLIPRRNGDVAEPRGGVRGVIPSKQKY
jgi:ATP adenylyltransferase